MNPWLLIAIIAFAISAIALVVGIILFIKFNIPDVIGDLSGKTLEKEISAIREGNAKTGKKRHKSSAVNSSRGPITDKVESSNFDASAISQGHKSKRLDKTPKVNDGDETLPLQAEATMPLQDDQATMPLQNQEGTELLGEGTALLQEGTTMLESTQHELQKNINFRVTETVMLVNTEENIND